MAGTAGGPSANMSKGNFKKNFFSMIDNVFGGGQSSTAQMAQNLSMISNNLSNVTASTLSPQQDPHPMALPQSQNDLLNKQQHIQIQKQQNNMNMIQEVLPRMRGSSSQSQ